MRAQQEDCSGIRIHNLSTLACIEVQALPLSHLLLLLIDVGLIVLLKLDEEDSSEDEVCMYLVKACDDGILHIISNLSGMSPTDHHTMTTTSRVI